MAPPLKHATEVQVERQQKRQEQRREERVAGLDAQDPKVWLDQRSDAASVAEEGSVAARVAEVPAIASIIVERDRTIRGNEGSAAAIIFVERSCTARPNEGPSSSSSPWEVVMPSEPKRKPPPRLPGA